MRLIMNKKVLGSVEQIVFAGAMVGMLTLGMWGMGCRTVTMATVDASTGKTNVVSSTEPDATAVALVSGTAKSAAYLGTKIYLEGLPPRLAGHPEAREQF